MPRLVRPHVAPSAIHLIVPRATSATAFSHRPDAHERAAANPCFDPHRLRRFRLGTPEQPLNGGALRRHLGTGSSCGREAEVVSRRQVVPTSGHLGVDTFAVVERGLRLKKLCTLARLPDTGVDASASTRRCERTALHRQDHAASTRPTDAFLNAAIGDPSHVTGKPSWTALVRSLGRPASEVGQRPVGR
jgi:hypothetical protein